MKWWNQWTRKHDEGWVERKRRALRMFTEKISEATAQKVPAVACVTVPETRVTVPNRGEK